MMRLDLSRPLNIITSLTVCCVIACCGCQNGIFKKSEMTWKRPDMSGLAFWRKKDLASVPPPPAHHFDPAPASGDLRTADVKKLSPIQRAAAKTSLAKSASPTTDVQSKFDQLVQDSKQQAKTQTTVGDIASAGGKTTPKPIRSPYSLSNSTADESVEKAQADFNAALSSSNKSIKSATTTQSAALNSLVKNSPNDFQLPGKIAASQANIAEAKKKIDAAQNSFDPSLKDVNQSLYDASGSLTSNVKSAASQKISKALEPSLTTTKNLTVKANDAGTTELQNVQSEVAMAQQQMAELREQIAASKKLAAEQTVQQTNQFARTAASVPNHALNMASQTANQATERVAQFTASNGGNFSPLQPSKSPSANSRDNVLRSDSQFSANANNFNSNSPTYQPTSQTGFATEASVGSANSGRVASLGNQFRPNSEPVIRADVSSANQFGVQSHNAAANHVSDIDIPSSVLRGSGNYAPGSVNRLMPNE